MIAETRMLRELIPALKHDLGVRVYLAGNPASLPPEFSAALNEICELGQRPRRSFSRASTCWRVTTLMKKLWLPRSAIGSDPEQLIGALSVPVELDAVIRTGADHRISGFLPLQCKYAELFFEPYYFPGHHP